MITDRTKVRPRSRTATVSARETHQPSEPSAKIPAADDAKHPLRVLARLPEVSASSDRAKLSLRLDWLKSLDWQRVRRMNLDPNWVAGGVLALVLFLLLVITLNRSPTKPPADTTVQSEAPTWSSAAKAPIAAPPIAANNVPVGAANSIPTSTATNSATAANPGASSSVTQPPASAVQPADASGVAANSKPNQVSLQGIFYPRTPHAAPVGIVPQPSPQYIATQPAGQPAFGDGIRTAQRDVSPAHRAPASVQTGPYQSGRAQFDGTIHQP